MCPYWPIYKVKGHLKMIFPYRCLEYVHLISLELPYWKVLRVLFGRPQDASRRYHFGLTYRTTWGRPHGVGMRRPLVLHITPYGDVHRTSGRLWEKLLLRG